MGKIARDQHLPTIDASPAFALAATVDPHTDGFGGAPHFRTLDDLIERGPAVQAISLCTPPKSRRALASRAIEAGYHVLLEKPPGASVAEVTPLTASAAAQGLTLFAAWHSRFAGGVAPARACLAERAIRSVSISWREDVRKWHPGQQWIWEPGGLGVFDPGINALSIATAILPLPLRVDDAALIQPDNRTMPIAARLRLRDSSDMPVAIDFDWRQTGPQTWTISVETDEGSVRLADGGATLTAGGKTESFDNAEYPALYAHFARLIARRESDVDLIPFQLVADAFLLARRERNEAFSD